MGSQKPGRELWGYPDVFRSTLKKVLCLSLLGHKETMCFPQLVTWDSSAFKVSSPWFWRLVWAVTSGVGIVSTAASEGSVVSGSQGLFMCPRVVGTYWMKNKIAFSMKCIVAELTVFVFFVSQNQECKHLHQDKKGTRRFSTCICLTSLRKGIAIVSNDGCKQIKWRMIIWGFLYDQYSLNDFAP